MLHPPENAPFLSTSVQSPKLQGSQLRAYSLAFTNQSQCTLPICQSRTITQDFFPPKPDGVSAHDDDVTLLPYLVLQSPCHSRRFIRKYLSPFRTLHFHQEQYTSVRGRRILPDPYPRDVNRNREGGASSGVVHVT
ncbi:hypothetical protein TNCV_3843531 [Trichonephila clavipes]|nr:hypothetical protein TNCV_3843531 [Trichonephila clavipes]